LLFDEDIELARVTKPTAHEPINVPFIPDLPMTRSRTRFIQNKFNAFIENLVNVNYHAPRDFEYSELEDDADFPSKIEDGQDKLLILMEENPQAGIRDHQNPLFYSRHEPWPMIKAQAGCNVTTVTNP